MATAATGRGNPEVALVGSTRVRPNLRFDHVFFFAMAVLILAAVLLGFTQTFYLRGLVPIPRFRGPHAAAPLGLTVVIHGAVFSAWILLLITQTSFVAAHRIDLHRRLGLLGFGLLCLVFLAGLAVTCEDLSRHFAPGNPRIGFSATQVLRVVSFSLLAYFGYRLRRNPAAHKRLMLIATINLLPAAVVRWPIITAGNFLLALLICLALLGVMVCYDLLSTGTVRRATLAGIALTLAVNPPIVMTYTNNAVWFRVATYMQALGRFLR